MKKIFTILILSFLVASIGWFTYSNNKKEETRVVKIGAIYKGSNFKKAFEGFQSGLNQSLLAGQIVQYIVRDVISAEQKDFDIAAQELVDQKVDLIFAVGIEPVVAAKKVTAINKIPVIFGLGINPYSLGIVVNPQKPEGNLTGISWQAEELSGKRMELLNMIDPRVKRVTMFRERGVKTIDGSFKYIDPVKESLGIVITVKEFSGLDELKKVLLLTTALNTDAIFYAPDTFVARNFKLVIEQATKEKIPTMWSDDNVVLSGGTASYGGSLTEAGVQVSRLARRILFEGKNPADLPIEVVSNVDFVINLVSAKKIGLVISPEVISIAHKVIQE